MVVECDTTLKFLLDGQRLSRKVFPITIHIQDLPKRKIPPEFLPLIVAERVVGELSVPRVIECQVRYTHGLYLHVAFF